MVALTSVLENASITSAIRAGAVGYLLKGMEATNLRRAIKAVAAHQVKLSLAAAVQLLQEVHLSEEGKRLPERETDVLRVIARGKSNKEIARDLSIGEETHVTRRQHAE